MDANWAAQSCIVIWNFSASTVTSSLCVRATAQPTWTLTASWGLLYKKRALHNTKDGRSIGRAQPDSLGWHLEEPKFEEARVVLNAGTMSRCRLARELSPAT